jgi:predicted O-linked N-acetylglucosamine transferase (SPINDLY family)
MNQALWQNAQRAHQAGDLEQAARLYGEILRADPRHFDTHYSLGFLYFQCGQFEPAERMMARASLLNAHAADPYFVRGCALQRMGRTADALAAFDRAIALRPGFVEALVNRGALLFTLKRYGEALPSLDAALALDPTMAQAWNNRANVLSELGRYGEAVESYDKGLALRPRLPEALINRGTALLALDRENDAFASYDDALRENPESADALNGRANAEFALKDYAAAANDYEAALARRPDYAYARGNLLFSRLHLCDWRGWAEACANLTADLALGLPAVHPFQAIALGMNPAELRQSAALWTSDHYPADAFAPPSPREHTERIRLGYFSADFNQHAVSTLTAPVFESHDRARFEIFAFAFSPGDGGPMRARMETAFDHFIEVAHLRDDEVAALARARGIDIAIDLMGYTGHCRPGIFARRAGPLQASWLGFPGTMGAPFMDYILADRVVIPEESRGHYSEAVAYLPDCYLPADPARFGAALRPERAAVGLPETGFVFAAFNAGYKIAPEMFALWMRLLGAVEGSVLWLSEGSAAASRGLRKEAALHGVAPERLVFAPFLAEAAEHLARLPLADLFLDTQPYGAHSTAADALGAGVPVLTTPGETFAGRVAASQLHALGLPELIAPRLADYEAWALGFARAPETLAPLREKLARNRITHPLFDGARFTRNLESAYDAMWDRARRGEAPGPIG